MLEWVDADTSRPTLLFSPDISKSGTLTCKDKYYMRATQFITESALNDLERHLPSHIKHGHHAVDDLMHKIARRHNLTDEALHSMFKRKHMKSPHDLIKDDLREEGTDDRDNQVKDFIRWSIKTLHVQRPYPHFTLSEDTEDAQENHHTGQNNPEENTIWVYVGKRNLVDIFRTIFHELTHTRQYQMGMVKDGDSYPGSPIEVLADAMAGKYIKIYGKEHPEIFQ